MVTEKDAYDKFKHDQFLRKKEKASQHESELKARALKKETMKQYHSHIEANCPKHCTLPHYRKQRTRDKKAEILHEDKKLKMFKLIRS